FRSEGAVSARRGRGKRPPFADQFGGATKSTSRRVHDSTSGRLRVRAPATAAARQRGDCHAGRSNRPRTTYRRRSIVLDGAVQELVDVIDGLGVAGQADHLPERI